MKQVHELLGYKNIKIIQDDDMEDDSIAPQSENVDKNLLLDLDVLSKDAPDIEIINDIDN